MRGCCKEGENMRQSKNYKWDLPEGGDEINV